MSSRIARLTTFVGVAALGVVVVRMLWMTANEATLRSGAEHGLTIAMERQNAWLASEEDAAPPLPVHADYTGLSPEFMARCLGANGVLSHLTGLLNAPNTKFGISPAAGRNVNRVITRALDRLAIAEKTSMTESKLSDTVTRYVFPANAAEVETALKEIEAVVNRSLPKDVAAGFLTALRGTAAFRSYPKQHTVHVSSNRYGIVLSGGASVAMAFEGGIDFGPLLSGTADYSESFSLGLSGFGKAAEELSALNLRWGHIARVDETTGAGMWGTGTSLPNPTGISKEDSIPAPFAVLKDLQP